jgi:hypothetical protein
MLQLYATVITVLTVACAIVGSQNGNVISMTHNDDGSLKNCGPPESEAVFHWSPRVLKVATSVIFDVGLKLIEEFSAGTLCATVWLQGVPDPIYQDCHEEKCEDALNVLKKFLPGLECPVPKGYGFSVNKFKYYIPPSVPLPAGKFKVNANFTSDSKKLLLCFAGDIEIQDDD